MRYLLAALADLPRAAVVVEDRYSQVFTLDRVRPAVVADGIAECQARFPQVQAMAESAGEDRAADFAAATAPSPAQIRAWAREHGLAVSARGRISADVLTAHQSRSQ